MQHARHARAVRTHVLTAALLCLAAARGPKRPADDSRAGGDRGQYRSHAQKLVELGKQFGTDKVQHGFLPIYADLFGPPAAARAVMEVGVFRGASIQMWRDYFANAQVYGIDAFTGIMGNGAKLCDGSCIGEPREGLYGPRVHLLQVDQANATAMDEMVSALSRQGVMLDIIIEDGSHKYRDQQLNMAQLLPIVRPGGLYVIEDLHTSMQTGYDAPPESPSATLSVINQFRELGRMSSPYLAPSEWRYLEKWIESARPVFTKVPICCARPNSTSSVAVVRKAMAARRPTTKRVSSSSSSRPRFAMATAASRNHAASLVAFLTHLTSHNPTQEPLAIFDMGLGDDAASDLRSEIRLLPWCTLRTFDYDAVPAFMKAEGGPRHAGEYAWKAVIVDNMLREADNVLWLDTGVRLRTVNEVARLAALIPEAGFVATWTAGNVSDWTHNATIRLLDADELRDAKMCNAAAAGFSSSSKSTALVRAWVECSMNVNCIAPPGSSRKNHRQDQSALSILATRIFGANVCTGMANFSEELSFQNHVEDSDCDCTKPLCRKYAAPCAPHNLSAVLEEAKAIELHYGECEVLGHFHIGETGGTHVAKLFAANESWSTAELHGASTSWRFGAHGDPNAGGLKPNATNLYLESHCSASFEDFVRVMAIVSARFAECKFRAMLVLRDPVDLVCSQCHRHTTALKGTKRLPDWPRFVNGTTARQHHVEIMKYGLASCNRGVHATHVDDVDVARIVRLVKGTKVQAVTLAGLDGFLSEHYGMRASHHNQQQHHKRTMDKCDGQVTSSRTTSASSTPGIESRLHADLALWRSLVPDEPVQEGCSPAGKASSPGRQLRAQGVQGGHTTVESAASAVALLSVGVARSVLHHSVVESFHLFRSSLPDDHGTFLMLSELDESRLEQVRELYQPTALSILPADVIECNPQCALGCDMNKNKPMRVLTQYTRNRDAWRLLLEWEMAHSRVFDWVVKVRPDLLWLEPFPWQLAERGATAELGVPRGVMSSKPEFVRYNDHVFMCRRNRCEPYFEQLASRYEHDKCSFTLPWPYQSQLFDFPGARNETSLALIDVAYTIAKLGGPECERLKCGPEPVMTGCIAPHLVPFVGQCQRILRNWTSAAVPFLDKKGGN